MLPLKNRLKSREDFFAVSKQGSFISAGAVSINFLKNGKDSARIGFSVGLKFSKKAVERNLVKRKLRAVAGKILPRLKENIDVIVMVKKISPKVLSKNLMLDLEEAFRKVNLINSKK